MADQLCTLIVGGVHFGIDVLRVQEVIQRQSLTRVPRARPAVAGLINLRGQIVTAVDLRVRLGMPAGGADGEDMNVVVHTPQGVVSLLVDAIGDVVDLRADLRQRTPENLPDQYRDVTTAVHVLEDGLLLQLDVDQLVELPELAA